MSSTPRTPSCSVPVPHLVGHPSRLHTWAVGGWVGVCGQGAGAELPWYLILDLVRISVPAQDVPAGMQCTDKLIVVNVAISIQVKDAGHGAHLQHIGGKPWGEKGRAGQGRARAGQGWA